jgi:hypothetical protein
MIPYLLRSGGCLLLLLASYWLLLEREKMFHFNRTYLLVSLVFSFIVPFIPVMDHFHPLRLNTLSGLPAGISRLATVPAANAGNGLQPARPIPFDAILLICYSLITLVFLARFIRNLYLILRRASAHEQILLEDARLVLVSEKIVTTPSITQFLLIRRSIGKDCWNGKCSCTNWLMSDSGIPLTSCWWNCSRCSFGSILC